MACDIIAIRFFINHSMKKEISQKIKVDLIYSTLKKIKFYYTRETLQSALQSTYYRM